MKSERWYLRLLVGTIMLAGAASAVAQNPGTNRLDSLQKQVEDQGLVIKDLTNQLAALRKDHDQRLKGLGENISNLDKRDAKQHEGLVADLVILKQADAKIEKSISELDTKALHNGDGVRLWNNDRSNCMDWRAQNDVKGVRVIQGIPCNGHPNQRWELIKW